MLSLAGFVGCKDDNKERNTVATPPDADALVAETTAPNEPAAATAPNTQVDATVPSGLTVADIASLRMAWADTQDAGATVVDLLVKPDGLGAVHIQPRHPSAARIRLGGIGSKEEITLRAEGFHEQACYAAQ
jgi:hypothetical protein